MVIVSSPQLELQDRWTLRQVYAWSAIGQGYGRHAGGVPLEIICAAVAKAAQCLPAQLAAVESAMEQVSARLIHSEFCSEAVL